MTIERGEIGEPIHGNGRPWAIWDREREKRSMRSLTGKPDSLTYVTCLDVFLNEFLHMGKIECTRDE